MNLVDYAKSELEILEQNCGDDTEALNMQKIVTENVLNIVKTFADQGHSGFSANYILNLLERLLRYNPLTPIEDIQEDWLDLSQFGMDDLQHKRCSSVFKRKDGTAYWVEGKIFSDDNGKSWYTSRDSIVDIEFPFNVPLYSENVYVEPSETNVEEVMPDEKK